MGSVVSVHWVRSDPVDFGNPGGVSMDTQGGQSGIKIVAQGPFFTVSVRVFLMCWDTSLSWPSIEG